MKRIPGKPEQGRGGQRPVLRVINHCTLTGGIIVNRQCLPGKHVIEPGLALLGQLGERIGFRFIAKSKPNHPLLGVITGIGVATRKVKCAVYIMLNIGLAILITPATNLGEA
jgi:hypothetical protein